MKFKKFAEILEEIGSTDKRNKKINLASNLLEKCEIEETEAIVNFLLGWPVPKKSSKKIGINWKTIKKVLLELSNVSESIFSKIYDAQGDLGETAHSLFKNYKKQSQSRLVTRELGLNRVYGFFEKIASQKGSGSRKKKMRLLKALLSDSNPIEAKFIVKIILEEMRTGFGSGLLNFSISKAFDINIELVRRKVMVAGAIEVIKKAKRGGKERVRELSVNVFQPIHPMLAEMASDTKEVFEEHQNPIFEVKVDGVRVQLHGKKEEVKIFSRRLSDISNNFPEIVYELGKLKQDEFMIEGEIVAFDDKNNFPLPFQELMKRFRSDAESIKEKVPVKLFLFDLLYLNGKSFFNQPYVERRKKLKEISEGFELTEARKVNNSKAASEFLEKSIEDGHEGLIAKDSRSNYSPGARGKKWLKIKPTMETLDLAVVAAEFGHGKRSNWLSDYYLGARDGNGFSVIGKTYKGLSDEGIREVTEKLKSLEINREGRKIVVEPELVFEISFNEIQESPKYKSGFALRFARVEKIRYDLGPRDVDSIERVRGLYEKQNKRNFSN